MSYDRQLDQVCPHLIVDEPLYVSPVDLMTIRPIMAIASTASVKVRLNGALDVPSYGYSIPAQIVGSRGESFNISSTNNTVVIRLNQGQPITLSIPSAKGMSAEKLAAQLNQVSGIQFYAERGKVGIRTDHVGPEASFFILSGSTLAATLGLTVNREYRGKTVAPGWSLISDPATLEDRPSRFIIFDDPIKDNTAFVEISYVTIQPDCRRCNGEGVEHDWRYGRNGEVAKVQNEALLLQDLHKYTFTNKGSNRFHKWLGTLLNDLIGKKQVNGITQGMVVAEIQQAFRNLQTVKKIQEETVGQFLTDEEYPLRLLSVNLTGSQVDPTVIEVTATVQNRSQKAINITRGVILPSGVNLFGTPNTGGNIRQSLANYVLAG